MKSTRLIVLFLSAIWLAENSFGQTANIQTLLNKMADEESINFYRQKAEAIDFAKENNLPVRLESDESTIELMFIDKTGMPQYYLANNVNAAITISTNLLCEDAGFGLDLEGENMTLFEWDAGAVRKTHQEFTSRIVQADGATNLNSHSTHVAGIMIANGTVSSAKGMAPKANLKSYDWNNDLSEMTSASANNNYVISNHSYVQLRGWWYGGGQWNWWGNPEISEEEDYLFGFYNDLAASWDLVAYLAPNYLIVKSAGNDRGEGPSNGLYPKDGPYDCINGSGLSKNLLTVGAVYDIPNGYNQPSDVVMSSFSTWGPTDDGRIKPDICASGMTLYSTDSDNDSDYKTLSGTSMSAPTVAGSLLLLQQHHQNCKGSGEIMNAATLKALVLHTADECGPENGPDYMFGWGLLNTLKAAKLISKSSGKNTIEELTIREGETFQRTVKADPGEPLKITICWTDLPGAPVDASLDPEERMLINDLNLKVTTQSDTTYPWKLDKDNPEYPATRNSKNNVDNVEIVEIANPSANVEYTITIDYDGVLVNDFQNFSMIVSGISIPISLPYFENWEIDNGKKNYSGTMCYGNSFKWTFQTDDPGKGRVNWGTNAFITYGGGGGALTLDTYPNSTFNVSNSATLTVNLSDYINSTDLELSFWWTDHGDEENPGDKVWLRGSINDEWIEVYDINPTTRINDSYNSSEAIDIDQALLSANPAQYVSETFQVKFGQQDNGPTPIDGISFDDILIREVSYSAFTLPFVEGWENYQGIKKNNAYIFSESGYSWYFKTDLQNKGKVRWGQLAFQSHDGEGALTLDKDFPTSSESVNSATLTLNLSEYTSSTGLELSFWWTDHGDEENPGDKVWIRGSKNDEWVVAYDINPQSLKNNHYNFSQIIDIDELLSEALPAQTVSETFQVKLGQQDNGPTPNDGISFDDIMIREVCCSAYTLPFIEDWENYQGTLMENEEIFSDSDHEWFFETNLPLKGRARWGPVAFLPHNGEGAVTLDKDFPISSESVNSATLTLNLTEYTSSAGLELSFWWTDHGDEENPGDKVWIRGNKNDEWIVAFDINPQSKQDNLYNFSQIIDIDELLSESYPAQTVSETFQVKFGQQDNGPTPNDGISFDDIIIEENIDLPSQQILSPFGKNAAATEGTNESGFIKIFASNRNVMIQSSDELALEEKLVVIYDMFGRTLLEKMIPPSFSNKIPVNRNNCFLIVKVHCRGNIYLQKVFVN